MYCDYGHNTYVFDFMKRKLGINTCLKIYFLLHVFF